MVRVEKPDLLVADFIFSAYARSREGGCLLF